MRSRGGATVELAILMLIIVPTFLYAVFLDDLLRYRLDLEEAVTSSPWDYHPLDYTQGALDPSVVQHNIRLEWCDHTSAYDSYDYNYDCQDEAHHNAVGAHVCWLQSGAHQVTCHAPDSSVGASYLDPAASNFSSSYTNGGLVSCDATVAVLNYLLPQEFMQQFSRNVMTNRQEFKGDVHSNAQGASNADVYLMQDWNGQSPGHKFGIVTDSWALDESPNIDPGSKSGKFYDRVNTVFTKNIWGIPYQGFAAIFMGRLMSEELLTPGIVPIPIPTQGCIGGMADCPTTPNLGVYHGGINGSPPPTDAAQPPQSSISEEGSSASYYATPWKDWDQDEPEQTWNNRGQWYMGHTSSEQ